MPHDKYMHRPSGSGKSKPLKYLSGYVGDSTIVMLAELRLSIDWQSTITSKPPDASLTATGCSSLTLMRIRRSVPLEIWPSLHRAAAVEVADQQLHQR